MLLASGKVVTRPSKAGCTGEMSVHPDRVYSTLCVNDRPGAQILPLWSVATDTSGLFVGSGAALASGGPVGLWIGYCLMATMVYSMMVALGEIATLYPVAGAFTHFASRFADPALGFAVGYSYWYSWAITLPSECGNIGIADMQPSSWLRPSSSRIGTKIPTRPCTLLCAWC